MCSVSMFVSQICMIGELFTIGVLADMVSVLMLPVILPISPKTHRMLTSFLSTKLPFYCPEVVMHFYRVFQYRWAIISSNCYRHQQILKLYIYGELQAYRLFSPVPVPQPRIHSDVPEISQWFHVKGPISDENDQGRHLTSGA